MRKRSQLTSDRLQAPSLSAEVEGPVTFTLGKQHFAPIQYFNFEVGPFEVKLQPKVIHLEDTIVRKRNETYAEMLDRATDLLEDMFDAEFERTLNKFLDRMERMGEIVRDRKRR